MPTSTLTSKGQLTLPKAVRDALGVGPGDRIQFVQTDNGGFALLAATRSVMRLKGMIQPSGRPVSLADMEEAIASGAKGD